MAAVGPPVRRRRRLPALPLLLLLLTCLQPATGRRRRQQSSSPAASSPLSMRQLKRGFDAFEEHSSRWFLPGEPAPARKRHLQAAFREIAPVLRGLSQAPSFPPGLDPASLAARVISLRQDDVDHVEMALPLLSAALDRYLVGGRPLREHCGADAASMRRGCQDIYSLRCHALMLAGRGVAAAACVAEYNAPRPVERQFASAGLAHRQLPGLRAQPWWAAEEVPYPGLRLIRAHAATIVREVLAVTSAPSFGAAWDPLANDPTLTISADWNPRESWDSIPLYFDGRWNDTNCALFPQTSALLRGAAADLEPLFVSQNNGRPTPNWQKRPTTQLTGPPRNRAMQDARRFEELVPERLRGEQEYDEVPTLGIKIYRIWPRAGLKSHTGSPARLVNSLALQAPPRSTLTVGGDTRAWVAGEMHHFDDAFYHAVDNPGDGEQNRRLPSPLR
jgi:hypothetical protein